MKLKTLTKLIAFLGILVAFSACEQEEGEVLSLDEIQAQAIAEEDRYQLKTTIDIFDYKATSVSLELIDSYQKLSANYKGEYLVLKFPEVSVNNFLGSLDPQTAITFYDKEGRYFSSNNERFISNVSIVITQIDTAASTFSGNFSGKLYATDGSNPTNKVNQLNLINGQLVKVPFE